MVQEYKDDSNKTAVIGGPLGKYRHRSDVHFRTVNKDYMIKEEKHIDVETIVADSLFLIVD